MYSSMIKLMSNKMNDMFRQFACWDLFSPHYVFQVLDLDALVEGRELVAHLHYFTDY